MLSIVDTALDSIEGHITREMKAHNIPGCVMALTDRRELLKVLTYGFADVGSRAPVTPSSLFEIASMGKSFTSLALLQLRDERRLDVHAPVAEYLPWFQVRSAYPPITVHHLMNHTAGIARGSELAPYGLYDAWALREARTSGAPGAHWTYSSLGYKTLGFLLEALTGQTYRDVIQTRVLDRLGMAHTHAVTTFETRKKEAIGYRSLYDDRPDHAEHELVPAPWSEYGTADGSQASTAEDMAIYLRMLLNRGQGPDGRLISEESFDLMSLVGSPKSHEQYGYALVAYLAEGQRYLGHGGANAGYMGHMLGDVGMGLGVVVLTNRMVNQDVVWPLAVHALGCLRAANRGATIPAPPVTRDPVVVINAAEYAGLYRSVAGVLTFESRGARLVLVASGKDLILERRSRDSFSTTDPAFDLFVFEFGRAGRQVVEVFHGPSWYVNDRYSGPLTFDYPGDLNVYTGHYRTRNPELSNFRVAVRKGRPVMMYPSGIVELLHPIGGHTMRIGGDVGSPETLVFDSFLDGHALRAVYSGCPYYRTFTP